MMSHVAVHNYADLYPSLTFAKAPFVLSCLIIHQAQRFIAVEWPILCLVLCYLLSYLQKTCLVYGRG